ncbi:substrate-binding domain-containing protein [Desulfovibrio sp. JC010]|uniref:substrate-binding domain-containing protein n=1 Tax=Desulfovibrio sp. JC010 TaxID=2593641 RepID=UPI0013D19C63|nr:substrate-binding domain-containing protein [Desulfovibrio sp. JC010]NDV28586.1 substrate-binding domain-containing protein [Desulfovibrio sp. JC010]
MKIRNSNGIKFLTILFLLISILWIPHAADATDSAASKKLRIAVIPERPDLDFWKLLRKGVRKAAIDDGSVKVLWISPKGGSLKAQQRKVEWCIENKVDAIVVSPLHGLKMKPVIDEAIRNGIPVIQMVSRITFGENTSYIHSNNFHGGELAAQYLDKKLKGKGSVVLGMFERGNSPVVQRVDGFKHQLEKSGSKIKIAKSFYLDEHAKHNRAKIRIAMWGDRESLRKKSRIAAVIGMSESSCETLINILKKMGKMNDYTFVSFNPDPNMVQEIKNGVIAAGIAQDPYEIGRLAVEQAAMAARGHKIPAETMTEVYLVTKENLSQPKIQEILGLKDRTM